MRRPHVHVNVAMSADGKIDSVARQGMTISSPRDKERVDQLRARADGILVGGHTLSGEDPKLTVKSAALRAERASRGLPPNPMKIGVTSTAAFRPDGEFVRAGPARVVIFTTDRASKDQVAALRTEGVDVYVHPGARVDLKRMLDELADQGVRNLMVEGGGGFIFELLQRGLVDELSAYVAPKILGGATAPTPADGAGLSGTAAIQLELVEVEDLGDGIVLNYRVKWEASNDRT